MRGATNLNFVFVRFGKFLVIAALVVTTGAHWAALQTVAWTTMLAANLTTSSLTEAVSDTFDGEHPCPLCKAITTGKKSEQKSEATAPTLKMEFPPVSENLTLIAPSWFESFSPAKLVAESTSQKPPLPPPRGFLV